jgi:hypothetical protein
VPRKYIPDFIVRIDDGGEEPLNLILETKGYRGGDAQLKAETMKTLWVPGVNNPGAFGRWGNSPTCSRSSRGSIGWSKRMSKTTFWEL